MIAAGTLNRRLTIFRPETVETDTGEETTTYLLDRTVHCNRRDLTFRDVLREAGSAEAAEATFTIRFLPDVTTQNQVECEGTRYSILTITELGFREGLTLFVRVL